METSVHQLPKTRSVLRTANHTHHRSSPVSAELSAETTLLPQRLPALLPPLTALPRPLADTGGLGLRKPVGPTASAKLLGLIGGVP
jgi:hypothetical protein